MNRKANAGARRPSVNVVIAALGLVSTVALAQNEASLRAGANALLAIDQHRATVIERIVLQWGDSIATSGAPADRTQLRIMLAALRADDLLAAGLAGSAEGVRDVLTSAQAAVPKPGDGRAQTKALGETADDVVYTPVTPCRLVETRGTFAAVFQGGGAFAGGTTRTYTVQGGNGVCLAQLPTGLGASAVQLQVFGIPINSGASGDIEILPQGSTFGTTATEVYVGNVAFNTVSTTAKINLTNNEIAVQVRGGGAHLAIDVVGYFAAPSGDGGKFFQQGGNSFGTTAVLGTLDDQSLEIYVNNERTMRYQGTSTGTSPNIIGGDASNSAGSGSVGQTIAGGGSSDVGSCTPTCSNRTQSVFATVSGGLANLASAAYSTVSGGRSGTASGGHSGVGGGEFNVASGESSFVAGGSFNVAAGIASFAAGHRAKAMANGTFVFGDSTEADITAAVANQFIVTASNNIIMAKNKTLDSGCFMPGSTWACTSDRNMKRDFAEIDTQSILRGVAGLPLSSWRYDNEPTGIRHIGPTSQDFRAAFGLGHDDKTISMVDGDGIALAAIQGLHQLMQQKDAEITALKRELDTIKAKLGM